ncbi:MAG TPA: ABC transporter permease [Mycobacteriales bacterium]|nr:ABC transporter permease [Mycobacteriales bacterium]
MSTAELIAAPPAPTSRPGALRRQVGSELRLVFRRRRNVALLVLICLIPVLIGIAVKVSTPHDGGGPAFLGQITGNGLFLALTALTVCLPVFLPLAVAVVSGDSIAGEASYGTLRYLLALPVGRTRLLIVKAIGVLAYTAGLVAAIALVGLITGAALFGLHNNVTLLSGDTVSLANGLARAGGIALYVVIDLIGLAGVGLFFSTLTEVPVGAMAATIGFAIVSTVADAVPQLGGIRGLLLTHHWLDFGDLMRTSVPIGTLVHNALLPLAYAAVFGAAAWSRMTTADVTS